MSELRTGCKAHPLHTEKTVAEAAMFVLYVGTSIVDILEAFGNPDGRWQLERQQRALSNSASKGLFVGPMGAKNDIAGPD